MEPEVDDAGTEVERRAASSANGEAANRPSIAAIRRALRSLEFLTGRSEGAGVVAVARHLGVNRGTAYKVLSSLEQLGYVDQTSSGIYQLTLKLNIVAAGNERVRGLHKLAHPVLAELAYRSRELAQLATLEHGEMVFIAQAEGPEQLRVGATIGQKVVPHATSAGKVWLAFIDEDRREQVLARWSPLQRYTEHTIIDRDELAREVERVTMAGYATIVEEHLRGAASIGAPVYGPHGQLVAALTISGPSFRFADHPEGELIEMLLAAASDLSALWVYA